MIFNKEFIALPVNPKRVGQLKSLLAQLGLGDRMFTCEHEVLSKLPTLDRINFEAVKDKPDILRGLSLKFLAESLS